MPSYLVTLSTGRQVLWCFRSTFDLDRFLDWRESVRSRALPRQTSFAEGAS